MSGNYLCKPATCPASLNYVLVGPYGTTTGTLPLTLSALAPGTYSIVVSAYCNNVLCKECRYTFTVKCDGVPPKECCPYPITVKPSVPTYQLMENSAAAIVDQQFNFTGLTGVQLSEAKAVVLSYNLSSNFENECLGCKSKPFTWASVQSAGNIGAVIPKITLFGGFTTPLFNPTGTAVYQNPREVIWNNGSPFMLTGPVGINFIVPPPSIINCCVLSGKICVKFTFRDTKCRECEVIACFDFKITKDMKVDCVVSEWSEWSECTKVCNGGTQTRTRTVITPASNGGTCPELSETRACNEQPCPVDCVVSDWSEWSTCTKACGGGIQTRTRTVITPAMYGGRPCPTLSDTMVCNAQPCPVDCVVSAWSAWSPWSSDCGYGFRTRSRTVVTQPANGGKACPQLEEKEERNNPPCVVTWYRDSDGDGYGNPDITKLSATKPVGFVDNGDDCKDWDASVYPNAPELADGKDNDCDGLVDDGLDCLKTWYLDGDKDGFGRNNTTRQSCIKPANYVEKGGDCNDNDNKINPGATEIADGRDNNCNGSIDEGLDCMKLWYIDRDNDGYGDFNITLTKSSCVKPAGYSDNATDCKPHDASINPGATEICDSKDNNCNGIIDEGCSIPGVEGEKGRSLPKPLVMAGDAVLEVSIWPNPARDGLIISLDAFEPGKKLELALLQADGRAVATQSLIPEVKGQQIKLDVRVISAGYYLLQAKQGSLSQTKRVVIAR